MRRTRVSDMARTNLRDYTNREFTKTELLGMSKSELLNICRSCNIVVNYSQEGRHDTENMIRLILRHKGVDIKNLHIIDKPCDGGLERVQNFVKENLGMPLPNDNCVQIPAKVTVYDGMGLFKQDNYKIKLLDQLEDSNTLLVNAEDQLCGIFKLEKDHNYFDEYFLTADEYNMNLKELKNKNCSLIFFRNDEGKYLYETYFNKILPEDLERLKLRVYRIKLEDLNIEYLQETNTTLCVDFGTSNTTAGCFLDPNYINKVPRNDVMNDNILLNEINFVKFSNNNQVEKWENMVPTIVYTEDCSDSENIKFLFGYDAKNKLKDQDFCTKATVFQGIKRWVTTIDEVESIEDEDGNIDKIKRAEIIRLYIKYIILNAERQFKCKFKKLHISSPVKLKTQFIELFQEIMEDYEVEGEDVLDEGIAVIYNTIANLIDKQRFEDEEEYKALVIDCGGGTTDLASCSFKIEEGDISYKVKIKTKYENGDTNFGGNNITFRIMQFMKVLYANYYSNPKNYLDIDELIPIESGDIFRTVDVEGIDSIYSKFTEFYENAEAIIPTKYKEFENFTHEEYSKVRNNFFFLWEIADNMKKEFYRKTNILRSRFDSKLIAAEDTDIKVNLLNKWNLSILDNGYLKTISEFPNITFNIKEINKLIKADIYEVIRKFLEKFYDSKELFDFDIIKLTGQSCKIDIFKEAIKEFVPGRSIEFRSKSKDEDSSELKLSCLRGVVRYLNSKKYGDIEPEIINDIPVIPYTITVFKFNGNEKILIKCHSDSNDALGEVSKPLSIAELNLHLKNSEGKEIRTYRYDNNIDNYKEVNVERILRKFNNKIDQEDIDTIKEKSIKFFVYTDEESWGFFVMPVARQDGKLLLGDRKYFPFEENLSSLTFFDGLK